MNRFIALLDAPVQRPDQVRVRARNQLVHQFHHADAAAERIVNGRHLQADNTAAYDEHALRYVFQFQRPG